MATFVPRGLVPKDLLTGAGDSSYAEVVQAGTRATGYGDYPRGHKFVKATVVEKVVLEFGAADSTGTNTVSLYKGTGAVTGTILSPTPTASAVDATAANATATITGPWAFAAGEYLQVNATTVGGTPGARLRVQVECRKDTVA